MGQPTLQLRLGVSPEEGPMPPHSAAIAGTPSCPRGAQEADFCKQKATPNPPYYVTLPTMPSGNTVTHTIQAQAPDSFGTTHIQE